MKFLLSFGLAMVLAQAAWAGASILPNGRTQFLDGSGRPLAGGQVFFYVPNTNTPQNTWQDPAQTILNTNPVVLDAGGTALIWGSGNYREVVQDSQGNLIWDALTDQLATAADVQSGASTWGSTASGSFNQFSINIFPQVGSYSPGQTYRFISNQTITGAATLNVDGLGSVPITKFGSTSLVAGDISNGAVVSVVYDGTQFELVSSPGSAISGSGTGLQTVGTQVSVDPTYFRGYLSGLQISDGALPNTQINIAPGVAIANDQTTFMKLSNQIVKSTSAWSVGTGNGCLDQGTVATGTWYHMFVIRRSDTGVVDALCSTSVAPVMPNFYDSYRRIGSFRTDGSSNILPFYQDGDWFQFIRPSSQLEVSVTNPGTTAVIANLKWVPPGVSLIVNFNLGLTEGTFSNCLYLSDVQTTDIIPGSVNGVLGQTCTAPSSNNFSAALVHISVGPQIRWRITASDAGTVVSVATMGYFDSRGKNS